MQHIYFERTYISWQRFRTSLVHGEATYLMCRCYRVERPVLQRRRFSKVTGKIKLFFFHLIFYGLCRTITRHKKQPIETSTTSPIGFSERLTTHMCTAAYDHLQHYLHRGKSSGRIIRHISPKTHHWQGFRMSCGHLQEYF